MGVVYRAHDRERNLDVALKTLRRLDGTALYRFKKEFRSLADLVHDNLVTLYELMSTGDEWFFTMELLEGVSLLEYVRVPDRAGFAPDTSAQSTPRPDTMMPTRPGKPWWVSGGEVDLERLRNGFGQLVGAVQFIHEAGKLHRDIKPSNVMVTGEGRVVLCDFGLVTESSVADRTVEGALLGTPKYMSPEQATGDPATESSDWYAVGVMLFEALCGQAPFSGSSHEVLRQKREPISVRPRDLNADIPAELEQLTVDLLSVDPEDRPGPQTIAQVLGPSPTPRSSRRLPTIESGATAGDVLVGRDDVLDVLQQAMNDSRTHTRTMSVFLHGVSGVGKSAVVKQFLERLRDSGKTVVLEGRCYERESVPYKALDALIDALSSYLTAQPQAEVAGLLPPDISALARLFPVLERVPAIADCRAPRFTVADPQEARRRAFAALRALLGRLCEQRAAALFIDDLQWGDLDSAGFLRELLYSAESPALLFVATYRRDEAESSELVQALRQPPTVGDLSGHQEIALEPLPEGEARRLVRALTTRRQLSDATLDAIVRESGGSPWFLCELSLSSLDSEPGQIQLESVLRERIDSLTGDAQRLLEIVAVAGQPTTLAVALGAAAVRDSAVALEVLLSRRLVRLRQLGSKRLVESYHDRVRETVTAGLSEESLRDVHRVLARSLEAQDQSDPLELVDHWLGAGDEARAGHYAALAATMASDAFAFDRAARNYRLALELQSPTPAERSGLLYRLAEALAHGGRLIEAAETFLDAAALVESGQALDLKRRAVEQLVRAGRFDKGMALAEEVLADVGLSMPSSTRRAVLSVAFSRVWLKLRGLRFRERSADQVAPLALRRMEVCFSLSGGLAVFEPTLGTAFQMRHLRMALRCGEPNHVALAVAYEVGFRAVAGVRKRDECERLLKRADELAARATHPHAAATTRFTGGLAAYLTGQWQTAHERFDEAEGMISEIATGLTWERDVIVLFRMAVLLSLGEIGELTRSVPAYLREATERGNQYLANGLRSWRSNIAWLAIDEPDEAERQLGLAVDALPLSKADFHLPHYYRLLGRVQIALYRGQHERAWELIEPGYRDLHHSLIRRIQFTRIECAYLRARVALARAHGEARPAMLEVASTMARAITKERAEWGMAVAVLLRALVAAVAGGREAAHDLFAEAADLFAADGMALFHHIARWRQAALAPAGQGAELRARARAWMNDQAIAAPERFVEVFAPLPGGTPAPGSPGTG